MSEYLEIIATLISSYRYRLSQLYCIEQRLLPFHSTIYYFSLSHFPTAGGKAKDRARSEMEAHGSSWKGGVRTVNGGGGCCCLLNEAEKKKRESVRSHNQKILTYLLL